MSECPDILMLSAANSPLASLALIVIVMGVMMGMVAYMVLLERKVAAWIQDRYGPNRAGPLGLIQPIADVIKLFFKEEFIPARADRWLYLLAPIWIIIPALIGVAVVPLGGTIELFGQAVRLQIADVNVGVLYVLAVASLGVYAVVLGGWASNSKYSFLGGLRATAQMLSYEVPLALSLMSVVLIAGTLQLDRIVELQGGTWLGFVPRWNVFLQPFAFVIFTTCLLAESNRLPFDLPEAEQELVGGYHTEYSSMKFGLFFMAEYAHMLVSSTVAVVLFLGGSHFPGVPAEATAWYWGLLRIGVLLAKVFVIVFFFMQVRWTLPRFRFDQVMRLAWKAWVPATLGLLMANGLLLYFSVPPWGYTLANVGLFVLLIVVAQLAPAPVTGRQQRLQRLTES